MKKILLIEDNEDIRNNTSEILELSNYKVITAENGKIGVLKAIENLPDLILCDIMMPVLDGYGVLHAVQKNDSIRNTPFIFLTAKTDHYDFRKGMELGADDYITKPFDGTELLNAIDCRLKKYEKLIQEVPSGLEGLNFLVNSTKTNKGIQCLTENRNTNHYQKKQIIYSKGNHPNKIFYILKGSVRIYRTNEDGKELVTEILNAEDFLGYVPMFEGTVYKDSAEALEDTVLAIIPQKEFEELMHNNKEVAQKFIKILAKSVSEKEKQLLSIAYNSLRKKVAEMLLLLNNKYNTSQQNEFVLKMSRDKLASIAGTATESLIRTLSDFKSENLIDINGGNITILNPKKLEHLLN